MLFKMLSGSEDEDFEDIECHFTSNEWQEMAMYERKSYKSAAENYRAMLAAGINLHLSMRAVYRNHCQLSKKSLSLN